MKKKTKRVGKKHDYEFLSKLWKAGKTISEMIEIEGKKTTFNHMSQIIWRNRDHFPKRRDWGGGIKKYDIEEMAKLWNAGITIHEIMHVMNLNNSSVIYSKCFNYPNLFNKRGKNIRKYDYNKIAKMWNSGKTATEISKKLKIKPSAIYGIIHNNRELFKSHD